MNRIFWTINLCSVIILIFLNSSCKDIQQKQNQQPNVILIVADDQGYADIGCAELSDDVQTPNLDKLAERGVRFTQAYVTSPICNPSRAGIITGCYQQRWGTFWYGGNGIHDAKYKTLAELLKKQDYTTGYIGKVHYGSLDSDTSNRNFPLNHGFDYYFGHTSPRKHYLNHQQEMEDDFLKVKDENSRKGQSLRQGPLWNNFNKIDTLAFSTELFGKKACDFIEQNSKERFFLQLSFNAVHNFTHQLPPDYLNQKSLIGYHDWNPETEDYYNWYKGGRYPNNQEGREHYLGQLYFLDREIGRVLDHLAKLDLEKNTMVIYVSDNGGSTPIYANNFPLRGSKYVLYEGGIRVPMIISYPSNYVTNITLDNIVSSMDILPTICRAVGIEYPDYVDGIDLNPLLTNQNDQVQHDTLIWDTGHEVAVRAGKWKYRMASDDKNANYEMVEIELGEFLYDLENDPGETTNLSNEYPQVFLTLRKAHAHWKKNL